MQDFKRLVLVIVLTGATFGAGYLLAMSNAPQVTAAWTDSKAF